MSNDLGGNLLRYDKDRIFTWIDYETQNLCLNEFHNLPWQVAIVKTRGTEVLEERLIYIKWPEPFIVSKGAAMITGYSKDFVDRNGIDPEEAFAYVSKSLIECDIVAGHNVIGLETYLTLSLCRKLKKPLINILPKILDTQSIAKSIKLGIPYPKGANFIAWQISLWHRRAKGHRYSLSHLNKEYELGFDEAKLHNALVDLKLNIKVWDKQKWQVEI